MKAKTSKPTPTAAVRATGTEALLEAPWFMPKKPSNPAQTAQVHVLAHADTARLGCESATRCGCALSGT
jgi:hypothetical protein